MKRIQGSALSVFEGCGRRWWQHIDLGKKPLITVAQRLGTHVHLELERRLAAVLPIGGA